jgi:type II secretory ATPase GspE/PulE/Tfp pilus assembly ATPase PilB-like protein
MQPPMKFRDAITSRIKIMSRLDIAENACRRTAASRCAFAATTIS